MYLGIYDFEGDPADLLPAYDRMLAAFPESMILLHACVVRDDGITIYDACPSQEAFERFSGGEDFRAGLEAVGLPFPEIHGVPVHAARGPNGLVIG